MFLLNKISESESESESWHYKVNMQMIVGLFLSCTISTVLDI